MRCIWPPTVRWARERLHAHSQIITQQITAQTVPNKGEQSELLFRTHTAALHNLRSKILSINTNNSPEYRARCEGTFFRAMRYDAYNYNLADDLCVPKHWSTHTYARFV